RHVSGPGFSGRRHTRDNDLAAAVVRGSERFVLQCIQKRVYLPAACVPPGGHTPFVALPLLSPQATPQPPMHGPMLPRTGTMPRPLQRRAHRIRCKHQPAMTKQGARSATDAACRTIHKRLTPGAECNRTKTLACGFETGQCRTGAGMKTTVGFDRMRWR